MQEVIDYFYTKENVKKFHIAIDCKLELSEENYNEIISKGSGRPRDDIVLNDGLPIKYSITEKQNNCIIAYIKEITKCDVDYCIDNDIISLSNNHIVRDYCQGNPRVLTERGWPSEEDDLLMDVICFLCNAESLDKAMIKFNQNGQSKKNLSYTIIGNHEGFRGKMAINFQASYIQGGSQETILTITVLDKKQ